MYFSRFTQKSKKVIELSLECAREFGHNRVDSEHLLLGLSKEGDGVASRVLLKLGITPKYIEGKIIEKKGIIPITKANKIEHIKLNLKALDFDMEQQDYQRLNDFRCEEFDKLEVDWLDNGGIPIYKFANQVE